MARPYNTDHAPDLILLQFGAIYLRTYLFTYLLTYLLNAAMRGRGWSGECLHDRVISCW